MLLRENRRLTGLALLADGKGLIYAGPGGAVLVDPSGHRLRQLLGHRLDANEVALSMLGEGLRDLAVVRIRIPRFRRSGCSSPWCSWRCTAKGPMAGASSGDPLVRTV